MAVLEARRGTVAATVVLVVLLMAAIVAVAAPANWLALYVARATHGVLLLADADGTVWSGSAVVAVAAPAGVAAPLPDGLDSVVASPRLALPGRVTWALGWAGALAPVLHLTHDGVLLQPVAVRRRDGGWSLDAGGAVVPAALLGLAGAPLNTLLPDGRCELRWNALRIDDAGALDGEGTLRIAGLAVALSPVRPLGDYLATWSADASGLTWRIATERGPLALEGNGALSGARSQVRIVARAAPDAQPAVAAQLGPLLDMIGRRGTAEAVLQFGAS